ncbi:MAG: hypothetical protein LBE71_01640 [Dysgonamonadaceae bacterium]|jgi:hypothetical protein|nr:hypothetical protein [Dysgonamonadaceae bacterium]
MAVEDILRRKIEAGTPSVSVPAYNAPAYIQPDGNEPQEQDAWLNSPYLMKNYSEEQRNAVKNFNPATDGLALEHYVKTFQKPQLDEKALQKNRTAGVIGDGLKLLGQMFGSANGVKIEELDPSKSHTSQALSKEEEIRKLYQSRMDNWDRGYYNALMGDRQMKYNYLANMDKQMRADARYGAALEKDDARYNAKEEKDDARYEDQKQYRERQLQMTQQQNTSNNKYKERQLQIAAGKQGKPVPLRGAKGSLDIPAELWATIYPALATRIAGGRLPTNMGKRLTAKEVEIYVLQNIDKLKYGDWHEIKKAAGLINPDGAVEMPKGLMTNIQNIAASNPDNEDYAIEAIISYLNSEGFSKDDAINILNSIHTP